MLEEVGVCLRHGQPDAIGELETGVLAQRVDGVNEVVHAAATKQFLVEMEVERDRHAVGAGDRPAFLPVPLDEHLVTRQIVAGSPHAAVFQLLEVAGFECGPHGSQLLPELGAEDGEVRLHAELAGLDRAE